MDARVVFDQGQSLICLPMKLPMGRTVEIGEPRNLKGTVTGHTLDGLSVVQPLPKFFPRRAWGLRTHPLGVIEEHGPEWVDPSLEEEAI